MGHPLPFRNRPLICDKSQWLLKPSRTDLHNRIQALVAARHRRGEVGLVSDDGRQATYTAYRSPS